MDDDEVLARLVTATMPLLANQKLGRLNVREQAVMHRLARELQPLFPDWDVDADYNRRGDEVKRLQRLGGGQKDIRPDILIHIMGEPINLLAVELKLDDNNDIDDDIFKLEGLTHPEKGFAYPVGVHLQLDFKRTAVVRCTVFKAGSPNDELTASLREEFERALAGLKNAPEKAVQ